MNFDVFISYAHQDKAAADAACAKIEAEGVRCWIAPRDVPPGVEWAGAIIDAIDNCRVMVLIFSSSTNGSRQIDREAQRAFDKEKSVIPFRIEDVAPQKSLAYYLGPVHWLDALTPPLDLHLQKLSTSVKAFVQADKPGDDKELVTLQKTETRQEAAAKAQAEEQERQRLESEAAASREAEERARQAAVAEAESQRRERDAAVARQAEEKLRQDEQRRADEETQRKKDEAEAQRIAEDNRRQQAEAERIAEGQGQQQAEAERLAQEEKDRIRAAEAARPAEEETQNKQAASGAVTPSEKAALRRTLLTIGSLVVIAVITAFAAWFVERLQSKNSLTVSQLCYQATDANAGVAICTRAIEIYPNDQLAYSNRCWAYTTLGNYSAALPDCNQAIALDPKDKSAHNNRAVIYENKGQNAAAIADYQKALAIDPSNEFAQNALKRLGASLKAPGRG